MASGFANTCVLSGQAWRKKRGFGAPLSLVAVAVVAGMALAHPTFAQEMGGPDGGLMDGAMSPSSAQGQFDGGADAGPGLDEPVGVSVLDAPGADTSDTFAQSTTTSDAPGDAPVGLIEAPDGAPSVDAETLSGIGVDHFDDAPNVASFAERRTAQSRSRMLGPIGHPPVVVELFTSQGCSSCPPADDMLSDLAQRDDILALSWHVDYWDYLGWADEFARPEFTGRQQAYAKAWGERGIYTPQMVVGGTDTLIALRPAELMSLVDAQMARPVPVLVTSSQKDEGFQIELTPRAQIRNRVAIVMVRYAPERSVMIKAGENRGIAVNYRNVVLSVQRIAEWDGRAPLRMTVRAELASDDSFPQDTRHVILAQELGRGRNAAPTGPILAAIRLD